MGWGPFPVSKGGLLINMEIGLITGRLQCNMCLLSSLLGGGGGWLGWWGVLMDDLDDRSTLSNVPCLKATPLQVSHGPPGYMDRECLACLSGNPYCATI